jgi:hypothetical protein
MTAIAVELSPRSQDYLKDLTDFEWSGRPDSNPGASCARARRVIFSKSFLCTIISENKGLGKEFGCGTTCENMAPHAQGPPNFPHSEITAIVRSLILRISLCKSPAVWKTAVAERTATAQFKCSQLDWVRNAVAISGMSQPSGLTHHQVPALVSLRNRCIALTLRYIKLGDLG